MRIVAVVQTISFVHIAVISQIVFVVWFVAVVQRPSALTEHAAPFGIRYLKSVIAVAPIRAYAGNARA